MICPRMGVADSIAALCSPARRSSGSHFADSLPNRDPRSCEGLGQSACSAAHGRDLASFSSASAGGVREQRAQLGIDRSSEVLLIGGGQFHQRGQTVLLQTLDHLIAETGADPHILSLLVRRTGRAGFEEMTCCDECLRWRN